MSKTFKDKKKRSGNDNNPTFHTKAKHAKLNPFKKKDRKMRYNDDE
jgi:hypothetical protein